MSQSKLSPSTQSDGSVSTNNHLADDRVGLDANNSSVIGDGGGSGFTSDNTFTIDKNSSNTPKNNISSLPSDWLQLPRMDTFVDIFSLCCSTAVIVGSLVPYIPQYLKIKRSLSSDGFSTYGKQIAIERSNNFSGNQSEAPN